MDGSLKAIKKQPFWTKAILISAAVYNLVWGSWVVLFPEALFQVLNIQVVNYIPIWQSVGMIVGVYGIAYAIAAVNPYRYWPIVLVGLLGKVFGPIGFVISVSNGSLPSSFFWQIFFNDLIWWIPFGAVLIHTFYWNSNPHLNHKTWDSVPNDVASARQAYERFESQMGQTLREISNRSPLMLVFLRQSGCTFCRRTLADLQSQRDQISALGVEVAIVHMGTPMEGTMMLSKYDLDYFHRFSDPECLLYKFFGFDRGTVNQVLNPKVLWNGLIAGIWGGHGMGTVKGDSFQLPGVVVMHQGKSILAFYANDASEQFNYLEIAQRANSIVALKSSADSGELVV